MTQQKLIRKGELLCIMQNQILYVSCVYAYGHSGAMSLTEIYASIYRNSSRRATEYKKQEMPADISCSLFVIQYSSTQVALEFLSRFL